jgi:lipopolysaccharide transport system ATP-binding protein
MTHVIAEDLTVEFPIYGLNNRSLKNTFFRAATGGVLHRDGSQRVVIRALYKISFSFKKGDRVGILGHNGSGKSTLLRVIAGAYEPTQGSISVQGTIASMLSISIGMDAESTGYENIYQRGIIMGLRPSEINALTASIAKFSELGDYLHMPLRTYSSGMSMRLAFAISTSVPADIILMDEWMSVGDASFSEKAEERLLAIIKSSNLLFLASHDENLVRKHCNVIMNLDHGEVTSLERLN